MLHLTGQTFESRETTQETQVNVAYIHTVDVLTKPPQVSQNVGRL